MKINYLALFVFLSFFAAGCVGPKPPSPLVSAMGSDCSTGKLNNGWVPYVAGVDPTLLDTHVTYWRYTIQIPKEGIHIRIKGEFPYARYTSFNIYDQSRKNRGTSISDIEMHADEGSINPFLPGVPMNSKNRSYTVDIVPAKYATQYSNPLPLPENTDTTQPQAIELWYRIYVPNVDKNGGVAIPLIEVTDPESGKPITCPELSEIPYQNKKAHENLVPASHLTDEKIRFYPASGNAMYPNGHTAYLASVIHLKKNLYSPFQETSDKVAVLRFKPPTFPDTQSKDFKSFSGNEEVRYFSFCLSGASTVTKACIADYEMKKDPDGFITLVVGPDQYKEVAKAQGINYLNRSNLFLVFMPYRNLMSNPNFKSRFDDPKLTPPWTADDLEVEGAEENRTADKYIGDYAPQGKLCDWDAFLSGSCQAH